MGRSRKILSVDDIRTIVDMWGKGITSRSIAKELAIKRGKLDSILLRLRDAGYDLPKRRNVMNETRSSQAVDEFLEKEL